MIRRRVLLTFAVALATIGSATLLAAPQSVLAADEGETVLIKSLGNAKVSLQPAAKAKGQAREVVVVSAVPELNGGRPVASIVLLKGERLSTVSEPLD